MILGLTHRRAITPERAPRKRYSNLQHSNTPSLQHSNLLVLSVLILTCVFYFASAIAAHGATQSSGSAATAKATFAGGCFWCMEPPYDELDGVLSTVSGYMGGTKKDPTYEEVSSGRTGHAEIVQITYDPKKITYSKLLEVFWRNFD
ncbi:MAG: peptide-methionine (S)-S-oxide reductase, partial [Candidatus Binatia bacterium]